MIKNCIVKIVNYQREYGTRQLLKKCLITLKNALFFYKKEVVGCLSVTDQTINACPKIPVTIRAAEISDIPELKLLTKHYKNRDFLQWINDNYIFFIAQLEDPAVSDEASSIHHDGETQHGSQILKPPSEESHTIGFNKKIVGYICGCTAKKSKHKPVSMLKLKDTDYWGVDAFIHPEYQGKGINAAIASGFLAQAKKQGFKRGFGTIEYKNRASRKAFALIGDKEIGLFTTISIMMIKLHFLKRFKGYEEYCI
jgi:GNAT superfamily N-acetyltransferase